MVLRLDALPDSSHTVVGSQGLGGFNPVTSYVKDNTGKNQINSTNVAKQLMTSPTSTSISLTYWFLPR